MKRLKTLTFCSVLLAIPAFGFANTDLATPPDSDAAYPVTGPVGPTPQSFVGMATGDYDQDLVQDLAYLKGGVVHVTFAPGIFDTTHKSTITANDLVSLPTHAGHTLHTLLLARDGGVERASWKSEAGQTGLELSSIGLAWGATAELRTYLAPTGMYLAGLDADGLTVRVAHCPDVYLTSSSAWSSLGEEDFPTGVEDFELVDWSGSGIPELVVAASGSMEVHKLPLLGAQPFFTESTTGFADSKLACVKHSGTGHDWTVRLFDYSGIPGVQMMAVYGSTGMQYGIDLTTVTTRIGKLDARDYDGNGIDDVILSLEGDYDIGVLFSGDKAYPCYELATGSWQGQIFSKATRFSPNVPGVPGAELATPGVLDVDNDGDLDLCIPTHADQSIWIYKEVNVVDHRPLTPELLINSGTGTGAYLLGNGMSGGIFSDPDKVPGADAIELLVWKQADPSSDMESVPVEQRFLLWDNIDHNSQHGFRFALPGITTSNFAPILYMSLRQVKLNAAQDQAIEVYPASVFMYHGAGTSPSHESFLGTIPGNRFFQVQDLTIFGIGPVNGGSGHDTPCLPFKGNNGPNSSTSAGG